MSCYEWEAGTITLPTAEAVRVRDVMKGAAERHRDHLYKEAQRFWEGLPRAFRRDKKLYQLAVSAFVEGNVPVGRGEYQPHGLPDKRLPAWRRLADNREFGLADDLRNLIGYSVLGKHVTVEKQGHDGKPYTTTEYVQTPPRRAQKADVVRLIGKTTGTTFRIQCGEPSISFEGRKVTWDVPENNHACDRARDHPLAEVFFKTLGSVQWTRGSGGDIVGNNEYSRDSREPGGGGNYVVASYGPDRKSARRLRAS